MQMQQVDGIDVPAGGETTLEPGGLHVMLIGVDTELAEGDTVDVTLGFENARERGLTPGPAGSRGRRTRVGRGGVPHPPIEVPVSHPRRARSVLAALTAVALLALAVPAVAQSTDRPFPDVIDLPTGFQPEGIVIAPGTTTAYAGSLADGSIVAADLRTGEVTELYAADGTPAVGIEYAPDTQRLFVAGNGSSSLEVVDTVTGELVDRAQLLRPGNGFVNDVAIDGETVYATVSNGRSIYAARRTVRGLDRVREITLGGEFQVRQGFNANGIVVDDDGSLIVVQSNTGTLFRVDPFTGDAVAIHLRGELDSLPNGDGLERRGDVLYVVQNQLDQIAELHLGEDPDAAEVVRVITDEDFDVPTTVDDFGSHLYVVNARFGIENPAEAAYQIVGTPLHD